MYKFIIVKTGGTMMVVTIIEGTYAHNFTIMFETILIRKKEF